MVQVPAPEPFGHGLSYTRFEYSHLRVAREKVRADESLEVSLDVTNAGDRAGQEVVQLYVRDPESRVTRPERELRAFAKVSLAPGETRTVAFTLAPRAFSHWDEGARNWIAEPGEFELCVGASSRDLRARASVVLEPA